MKQINLFVCEICGTQYAERLKAKDCEKTTKSRSSLKIATALR